MPIVDGLSAAKMIREYEVQADLGHGYVLSSQSPPRSWKRTDKLTSTLALMDGS